MEILSRSTEETLNVGRHFAHYLKPQDIVALFGELGSGKTVLVKGIAQGLGIDKDRINSPTFVLIKQYAGKIPLYHFDLYRLKDLKSIIRLGFEEYFYGQGITVVEWADRMKELLPDEYLKIELSIEGENTRRIKFFPQGKKYKVRFKNLALLT